MGFWSGLGKALTIGGSLAAIPFTGGASAVGLKAALPAILGGAGSVLSGMGGAATANRGEQDLMNLRRDQIGLTEVQGHERALQDRAILEIKQREEQRAAQEAAFKNAIRSALAMNMQDATIDRSGFKTDVPNISFSGGARPSALGTQGRQAAGVLNNQAMQSLMSPEATTELPAIERFQQSEPSKASFWEKLAGPLGMGLSVAGMGLDAANKPQVPQTAGVPRNVPATLAALPQQLVPPRPAMTNFQPTDDFGF